MRVVVVHEDGDRESRSSRLADELIQCVANGSMRYQGVTVSVEYGAGRRRVLGALADVPEPVMAQFDRLPLPMQMRVAARVLEAAGRRYCENPNTTWGPYGLREVAAMFDRDDYERKLAQLIDGS